MTRILLYAASGVIVGLLLGVGITSSYMIRHLDRMEEAINLYGLNSFLYGCTEGQQSDTSCLDITKNNENNIVLPKNIE